MEEEEDGLMPWSAFNPLFKFVKGKDDNNFLASCKLCPAKTEVSCTTKSSYNLKSHLKVSTSNEDN